MGDEQGGLIHGAMGFLVIEFEHGQSTMEFGTKYASKMQLQHMANDRPGEISLSQKRLKKKEEEEERKQITKRVIKKKRKKEEREKKKECVS